MRTAIFFLFCIIGSFNLFSQVDDSVSIEISQNEYENSIWEWGDISKKPTFPGGMGEFYKFIQLNFVYPIDEKTNKIEGTIYLWFVIEKNGKVSNVEILKGVSPGLDTEAVRVLKSSPRWLPGKVNNQRVRVSFTLPLKLSVQ